MFPTLDTIINRLLGTHIVYSFPTYNAIFYIAIFLAFLWGYFTIRIQESRGSFPPISGKEKIQEPITWAHYLSRLIPAFVFAYFLIGVLIHYEEFIDNSQEWIRSLKGSWTGGLFIALVLFLNLFFKSRKYVRDQNARVPQKVFFSSEVWKVALATVVFGLIGARLFEFIEHLNAIEGDFFQRLFISGGMNFYGAVVFGMVTIAWYVKKLNVNVWRVMDVAGTTMLAAYALGRMACMFSGDGCWGIENPNPQPEWLSFLPEWTWAFDFPHNSINAGVEIPGCSGDYCHVLGTPVFPTPIYESTMTLIALAITLLIQRSLQKVGQVLFVAVFLLGINRLIIERIRINPTYEILNISLTQADMISIGLLIISISGFLYLQYSSKSLSRAGRA